jgi:hypothetical protein
MHYLSVGAVFRNEEHAIVEWIEHYLLHGVDHFYLIDDQSTDSSVEKLKPYIERGIVDLIPTTWGRYLGRQRAMYSHYFIPRLKESKWFLIVDLDEFVWSPEHPKLPDFLKKVEHLGQVQMSVTIFGSNGHQKQPASMVGGFTKRSVDRVTKNPACFKYFVNTDYEYSNLNVHHATFAKEQLEATHFQRFGYPLLQLNHYSCQSREIWEKIKVTRGDCDEYLKRNDDHWNLSNQNDVDDFGLAEQNKELIEKLEAAAAAAAAQNAQ